ncbi:MAG: GDP-mannose 4,6-dehydratase [Nanoarchaeota archaeon]|nr:GDP-mannose 4,6-dehydratase [Nanoarchaeota archaeon]MBU4451387.1 GDP-mannose 4,6-dehydratase [Nanoarchaeota archaeon]MCG2724059.1 GDP-mannose 4,6-dehydratase [archaeon]
MACGKQETPAGSNGDFIKNNTFWKDRNVLITGCTGLLGSWLTKDLVGKGANIVGLIRDIVPKSNIKDSMNSINVVHGDVEDLELVERALNEYEIDTVFHLAAQTIVGTANRSPISTFETNIKGTWNVLEACRRIPLVKSVVIASSDKAYGDQKILPYDENTPLQGTHPYDVSKSCADLIAYSYYKTYGVPVCVTRCGNFYGGGDLNFNRLVPGTIRSVLNNERPIIRSNGTLIRDYIYVKDGVDAYILLAEKMRELKISGESFNFSNEDRHTVKDIVEKILKSMESKLEPIILNEAKNEILHQYLSAKKAREILAWKPKYTMELGLKETIEWYRDFFKA